MLLLLVMLMLLYDTLLAAIGGMCLHVAASASTARDEHARRRGKGRPREGFLGFLLFSLLARRGVKVRIRKGVGGLARDLSKKKNLNRIPQKSLPDSA